MADGDIGADRVLPKAQAVQMAALLQELTEALTALGNYLASANKICTSELPRAHLLGASLEKSLGQHARAVEATRRVRDVNRPRRRVEGDCLIGFR